LSQFGIDVALVEPGGFPTQFFDNLICPSTPDRGAEYGEMARAPEMARQDYADFLATQPQQSPQLVSDAVCDLISKKPGDRAFRTEVDRSVWAIRSNLQRSTCRGHRRHLHRVRIGGHAHAQNASSRRSLSHETRR
jgi:hypothetical protein